MISRELKEEIDMKLKKLLGLASVALASTVLLRPLVVVLQNLLQMIQNLKLVS